MAARRTPSPSCAPNGRATAPPPGEHADDEHADDEHDAHEADNDAYERLQELARSPRVALWRVHPHWASGFLCYVDVEHGSIDLEEIRKEFGGGAYNLRPMRRDATGSYRYAPGAVRVRIVGAPKVPGESGAAVVPTVIAAPMAATPRADDSRALVERLLDELAETRRALAELTARPPTPAPAPAPVSLGGLDGLAGLVSQLRELGKVRGQLDRMFGAFDNPDDDEPEPEPEAPASLEDRMLTALMDRMMGNGNAPKAAAPPAPIRPAAPAPPPVPPVPPASMDPRAAEHTPAPPADAREATAEGVIDHIGALPPGERERLVGRLMDEIPPEMLRALAAQRAG